MQKNSKHYIEVPIINLSRSIEFTNQFRSALEKVSKTKAQSIIQFITDSTTYASIYI